MVLALALCAGVAWYFGLLSTDPPTTSAQGTAQGDKVPSSWKPGNPLFVPIKLPPAQPLGDDLLPNPNGIRQGRQIVVTDGNIVPFDKQDASSSKDGLLLFVGNIVEQENALAPPDLPTAEVLVGGKKRVIAYKRWKEGDVVHYNDVLAMVDPTKALNDQLYKKAKIIAAQADHTAAIATVKEAQARLERLDRIIQSSPSAKARGLVSDEDYGAAKLTVEKYTQEEVSKREAINLAIIEYQQAEAEWELHKIRCVIPGKSYIKAIYKSMGEGVKDLGKDVSSVMSLYSLSRLQIDGTAEGQYFDQLEDLRRLHNEAKKAGKQGGIRVVLEPSQDMAGRLLPKAHKADITSVAVRYDPRNPQNTRFVTGSEDKTIAVWQVNDLRLPAVRRHEHAVRVVACSPPGSAENLCLVGCADGTIYLWNLDDLKAPVYKVKEHTDGISALAFSPDGKYFASGGQDNNIWMWDTKTGKAQYPFDFDHGVTDAQQGTITMLAFTPQGKLVSAARDNTLRVWALYDNGATLDSDAIHGRGGNVALPGVSADGKLMVFDQGRTLQLLSVDDHRTMCTLQNPAAGTPFETLALFSPDGNLMLTAGAAEGRMQLWRTPQPGKRGYEVRQLVTEERSPVTSAAFSPDGTFAISGTKDGYAYLWQLPTPEAVRSHRMQTDAQGQLLTLTHFDRSLDASKIRVSVNLQNPETLEYPDGRLIPGRRVTIVIDP
jgi:WD40 repeat protein